jgi:serine acetyltransferase
MERVVGADFGGSVNTDRTAMRDNHARFTLRLARKLNSIVTIVDLHPDAEIGPGT